MPGRTNNLKSETSIEYFKMRKARGNNQKSKNKNIVLKKRRKKKKAGDGFKIIGCKFFFST